VLRLIGKINHLIVNQKLGLLRCPHRDGAGNFHMTLSSNLRSGKKGIGGVLINFVAVVVAVWDFAVIVGVG
jgi:hypothetical protein